MKIMKPFAFFVVFFAIALLTTNCRKESNKNTDCWADLMTERQIADKPAVVRKLNNEFYLIEQGTIDTRLKPCKLETEFQVDGLSVTISGDVKVTNQNSGQPCCTENFVVTKITR